MTFRIDDLLVAVLSANAPDKPKCATASKCPGASIGTETQCGQNTAEACTPRWRPNCEHDTGCGETIGKAEPNKARAWRDEQFARLSLELENALAR